MANNVVTRNVLFSQEMISCQKKKKWKKIMGPPFDDIIPISKSTNMNTYLHNGSKKKNKLGLSCAKLSTA